MDGLLCGFGENLVVDVANEFGFFGDWDELVWIDWVLLWMLLLEEGFEVSDVVVVEVQHWLVLEVELV